MMNLDSIHLSPRKLITDKVQYVVDYGERKNVDLIFTSQTAKSHVDSLINARHKHSRKMQWNQESAHEVLQIRAKQASNEYSPQWQPIVLNAVGVAAQTAIFVTLPAVVGNPLFSRH